MKILSCDELVAVCRNDEENRDETVDLSLIGTQKAGDWILVFMGAAREVIEQDLLESVLQARKAMFAALNGGDVDAYFADLVGREPELPDFLKKK